MFLYRATTSAEIEDIVRVGRLRPGHPSNMGKWLATTLPDARKWAAEFTSMTGIEHFVLRVVVRDEDLSCLYYDDYLDKIGPGYFVEVHQVDIIHYDRVVPDSWEDSQ